MVGILGAAYSASSGTVYGASVTYLEDSIDGGGTALRRLDTYETGGSRLWTFEGENSAPAVDPGSGVIALFALDGQRILVGADGKDIERGYVTMDGDDATSNAQSWLWEGVLSIVANRVVDGGRGGSVFGAPRIWPGGSS